MAQLSVLEATPKTEELSKERREISAAERQHAKDIEVYRKMLYAGISDAPEANADVATLPAQEEKTEERSSAARRFADYKPYRAPAGKKVLFEGITYKNGELVEEAPVVERPVQAPAAEAIAMPVAAPAEEDAIPTRRTMETIRRTEAETATVSETKTSLLSAVSAKTKAALCAIAAAIVLAIVLICINTGIINAIDADIEAMRARVQEQQRYYEDLVKEIEDMEDIDGAYSEIVEEYAKTHGMARG